MNGAQSQSKTEISFVFVCMPVGFSTGFPLELGLKGGVQKEQRKTGQQRGAKSHFLHPFDYLLCVSIFLPHFFLGHLVSQPDLS